MTTTPPGAGDELRAARLAKIAGLSAAGIAPYRNNFRVTHTVGAIRTAHEHKPADELAAVPEVFVIAGRLMSLRSFGKSAFGHVRDASGELQVFFQLQRLGESYDLIKKHLDVGDIVGVSGRVMKTKTEEFTLAAESLVLLTKAVRALPEKWHGLTDIETRHRQRYLDMIANPTVRTTLLTRAKVISAMRHFLESRGYVEIETPVLHPIPGGATARPFVTHHNALHQDLYLRIATELYLKRLVVGGVERVFEIGRVFRNEGIDSWHNPEFTLLELYQAYATYEDLIALTEEMIASIAKTVTGTLTASFGERTIDLTPPWPRMPMRTALVEIGNCPATVLTDDEAVRAHAANVGVPPQPSIGETVAALYEECVESKLVTPIFITHFPVEISPLARRNDANPAVTDRFELIIGGKEIANAFSELTDPLDQRARLEAQVAKGGEEVPKVVDEDFLRALEYGMPPTAGEGIGIDRLVMLLTGHSALREVLAFPHLRPESA